MNSDLAPSLPPSPKSDVHLVPTKSGEVVDELEDTASNKYTDTGAERASSISPAKLTKVYYHFYC